MIEGDEFVASVGSAPDQLVEFSWVALPCRLALFRITNIIQNVTTVVARLMNSWRVSEKLKIGHRDDGPRQCRQRAQGRRQAVGEPLESILHAIARSACICLQ